MADTPADTSAITDALATPLTSGSDGQTATDRSMADKVLGVQFASAAAGVCTPGRGLRFTRALRAPALTATPRPAYLPPGSFQ